MDKTEEFFDILKVKKPSETPENYFYDDLLKLQLEYFKQLKKKTSINSILKFEMEIIQKQRENSLLFEKLFNSVEYRKNQNVQMFFDGIKSFFDKSFSDLIFKINLKKNNKIEENENLILFEEHEIKQLNNERNYLNKSNFTNKTERKQESSKFYDKIKKEEQSFEKIGKKISQIEKIQNVINKCLFVQNERINSLVENIDSSVTNVVGAGEELKQGVITKRRTRNFFIVFTNVTTICLVYLLLVDIFLKKN